MDGNKTMGLHNAIMAGVPAFTSMATYAALTFFESVGEPIGFLDKFGGAIGSGAIMFFVIRWLFNDKKRLENIIREQQQDALKSREAFHAQIVELITEQRKDKTAE